MSQEIVPFSFEGHDVRVVILDEEPWWVASDVARLLEFRDASAAVRSLESEERRYTEVCTSTGDKRVVIINESGLYALIFRSKKPEAKRIRVWVTSEVLPQIRKTGKYQVPGQIEAPARQMTEIELTRKHLEALEYIEKLEPRAELLQLFEDAREGMSIADVGALFGYKAHQFHEMCRVIGATYHNRNGYVRASKFWLDKGWLKSRRRGKNGTPAVTPEGLTQFESLLGRQVVGSSRPALGA